MTISTTIISTIIIGQIAYTAIKVNTAEYRETDLKAAYADFNENTQANTKINHDKKSIIYVRNLNTGQLNIPAINDNKY
jgi:hypothetical protein